MKLKLFFLLFLSISFLSCNKDSSEEDISKQEQLNLLAKKWIVSDNLSEYVSFAFIVEEQTSSDGSFVVKSKNTFVSGKFSIDIDSKAINLSDFGVINYSILMDEKFEFNLTLKNGTITPFKCKNHRSPIVIALKSIEKEDKKDEINQLVQINLETGEETIFLENSNSYKIIEYLESANQIIGIQSNNKNYFLDKIDLATKQVTSLTIGNAKGTYYDDFFIIENDAYAIKFIEEDIKAEYAQLVRINLTTGKETVFLQRIDMYEYIRYNPEENELIGFSNDETSNYLHKINLSSKALTKLNLGQYQTESYDDFILKDNAVYAIRTNDNRPNEIFQLMKIDLKTGNNEVFIESCNYYEYLNYFSTTNELIGICEIGNQYFIEKINLDSKKNTSKLLGTNSSIYYEDFIIIP